MKTYALCCMNNINNNFAVTNEMTVGEAYRRVIM